MCISVSTSWVALGIAFASGRILLGASSRKSSSWPVPHLDHYRRHLRSADLLLPGKGTFTGSARFSGCPINAVGAGISIVFQSHTKDSTEETGYLLAGGSWCPGFGGVSVYLIQECEK